MKCVPENSDHCILLHSMRPCLCSQGAGSSNCPLCQHRCLCTLLLFHLHHERWMFCHHRDRFLQTTARGDQRMPADPPVDKRPPSNTPVTSLNKKFRNVRITGHFLMTFSSFGGPLQLLPFNKHRMVLIYQLCKKTCRSACIIKSDSWQFRIQPIPAYKSESPDHCGS